MAEWLEQIAKFERRELLALIREATAQLERLEEGEWELSPTQQEEMRRRVADANANPLEGDDWLTVRARIVAQAKISSEEKAQIDAECDAYERDGDPGEPWEVVRARIETQTLSNAGRI